KRTIHWIETMTGAGGDTLAGFERGIPLPCSAPAGEKEDTMRHSRRHFLTYVGLGAYAALRNPLAAADQAAFPLRRHKGEHLDLFTPNAASDTDDLLLPSGFRYDIICAWGDDLGSKDPDGQPETFGFNNDFTAYFPIDALKGGKNSGEGLLWVNHEYPNPLFVSGYTAAGDKTEKQILAEKRTAAGRRLEDRSETGR